MIRPDLHCHTTSSDGVLSPRELVRRAAEAGVTLLAVTDHDTLNGADSLQGMAMEIPVLTGVELSLRDMHGLHLLGYGHAKAPELRRVVADLAHKRLDRARRMVEKLADIGLPMDYEAIRSSCGGSVGRLHIARAMVEHGYVDATSEAFNRYIGQGGPAYVEGERLSIEEAVPLMRRSGFVPVLAHPAELMVPDTALNALLDRWQALGLMGVEVYHPSRLRDGFATLDAMVRRCGLLVTGGSDYHTEDDRHGALGSMVQYWRRAPEDAQALLEAMDKAAQAADETRG